MLKSIRIILSTFLLVSSLLALVFSVSAHAGKGKPSGKFKTAVEAPGPSGKQIFLIDDKNYRSPTNKAASEAVGKSAKNKKQKKKKKMCQKKSGKSKNKAAKNKVAWKKLSPKQKQKIIARKKAKAKKRKQQMIARKKARQKRRAAKKKKKELAEGERVLVAQPFGGVTVPFFITDGNNLNSEDIKKASEALVSKDGKKLGGYEEAGNIVKYVPSNQCQERREITVAKRNNSGSFSVVNAGEMRGNLAKGVLSVISGDHSPGVLGSVAVGCRIDLKQTDQLLVPSGTSIAISARSPAGAKVKVNSVEKATDVVAEASQ